MRKLLDVLRGRMPLTVAGAIGVLALSTLVFLKLALTNAGSAYMVYDGGQISVRGPNWELTGIPVKPFEETVAKRQPRIEAMVDLLEKRGFKRIPEFPDLSPSSYRDAYETYQGQTYCMVNHLSNSWPVYVSITDDGLTGRGYHVWFFFRFGGWEWTWEVDRSWAEASRLSNALARDIGLLVMGWQERSVEVGD